MSKLFPSALTGLAVAMLASACAVRPGTDSGTAAAATKARPAVNDPDRVSVTDAQGNVVVQKIEFQPGVSSATVERLAKQAGCDSQTGAGRVTEPGPVEIYRMQCSDGRVFMARCELRQCRPVR